MVAADGVAAFLVHRGLRPDAGEVGELPLQLTGPRLERVVPLVPAHGAAAAAARRGARRLPAGDRLRQEHHPLRLDEPHAIAAALRLRRRRVQRLLAAFAAACLLRSTSESPPPPPPTGVGAPKRSATPAG